MEGSPKWSKKINGHRPYSYITLSRAYLTKTNWQGKRVKRVVGRAVKSSKLRNKLSLTTKELSTVTECVSALHTLFFLWIFLWFSRLPIVLRLFNKEIKYHQRLVTACQSILEVTRLGIFAAVKKSAVKNETSNKTGKRHVRCCFVGREWTTDRDSNRFVNSIVPKVMLF